MKTYAKNLIEGIISDTITRVHSDDADDEDKNNEETDVSLSLASEKETEAATVGSETAGISGHSASVASAIMAATSTKSPSSHVETDSLDESEHAGQHSWTNDADLPRHWLGFTQLSKLNTRGLGYSENYWGLNFWRM